MSLIQEDFQTVFPDVGLEDRVVWCFDPNSTFPINSAWNSMRRKGTEVHWHKILWFRPRIPNHCFMSWLALHNRLSALDRVKRWKHSIGSLCVLYHMGEESRNHSLLSCTYSKSIWNSILLLNGERRTCRDWNYEIKWTLRGKSLQVVVTRRLSWHAHLYYVWQARIDFILSDVSPSTERTLVKIKAAVQYRLCGVKGLEQKVTNARQKQMLLNWVA
ncbi:hypothetical protein CDL15_Pgr023647 [Punica granatum]|uniref:Reverse transcriptase zinc-binding domain-containing protein n=1 Tax=Punica granatum TaxID=22663 RepID=A0A218W9C5_PUNGR|nr:hypothetical protein CDL15_Pgr023647 [Punica granatum]